MSAPWRGWYHCIGTTYGTWLRGDRRGFRELHHRRHVEGDYRNPPPDGLYADLERRSGMLMKRPPVVLDKVQRDCVCLALGRQLLIDNVELVELCVDATHFHLLCRFPNWGNPNSIIPGLVAGNALQDGRDSVPRHLVGRAKKRASHIVRRSGLRTEPGGLWGKRTKIAPVTSRGHQLQIVRYIRSHAPTAAVWTKLRVHEKVD